MAQSAPPAAAGTAAEKPYLARAPAAPPTAIVDVQRSLDAGAPGTALGYLFGTLALALAATAAGLTAGDGLIRRIRPPRPIEVDACGRLDTG